MYVPQMVYVYEKNTDGEYVCPHCAFVSAKQPTMHMHYKANHDGALKHKCKDCCYETATKQALDNHITAKHPEKSETCVKKIACPCTGCYYETLTTGGLRSHYTIRHLSEYITNFLGKTENKQISCTCCGTVFTSKPSFVYHLVNCMPEEVRSDSTHRVGLGLS